MFAVTILGNNSALPAYDRHPTSQVVTLNDQLLLIDCGEGTQMQLSRYKVKRGKLNHIFISHLHGDHYFGLIGLITSMGLLGREQPLYLYAPPGLDAIIKLQLDVASTTLPYELIYHPLVKEEVILDTAKFSVECFNTQHRIPCFGFIVREKKLPRKVDKEKVLEFEIPAAFYNSLKQGYDYTTKDGLIIYNDQLTIPNSPSRSYAFCADTIYDERLAEVTKDVTLLYHEATFLHDRLKRAEETKHSTALQAGIVAQKANASKLIIGHFSSRYDVLDELLAETRTQFANSFIANEGEHFFME